MRRYKKLLLVGITFVSGIVSVCLMFSKNGNLNVIGSGVLASIIASFVFSFMSDIWNEDEKQQQSDNIIFIKGNIERIAERKTVLDKAFENGLERIELIDYADENDKLWINLLEKSTIRLDIIAHTLQPWFKDEYAGKFSEQITKILNSGKKVRILILDPEGDNLRYININDKHAYRRKIKNSISELCKIYNSIEPSKRDNLIVKSNGNYVIPYTYIRNDASTYISPYMCANASRSSFIAVCKSEGRIARGFIEDFDEIFNLPDIRQISLAAQEQLDIDLLSDKIIKTRSNRYMSQTWNIEDTTRYVFKVGNKGSHVEAGYYIHYMNAEVVEKVIELSTSYGCTYGCKYCASSKIKPFAPLTAEEMLQMLEKIVERNGINQTETFTLALTGSGDYSKTFKYVNLFLSQATMKYKNCKLILSSCAWSLALKESVIELIKKGAQIKFLQWTYISSNYNTIIKVIPSFPQENAILNIKNIIKDFCHIAELKDKFRINYLMIKDVNDSTEDFQSFVELFSDLKKNVLVRIAELNETSSSIAAHLLPAERSKLDELKSMCTQQGINAYIYFAEINDHMNCGQLITDLPTQIE